MNDTINIQDIAQYALLSIFETKGIYGAEKITRILRGEEFQIETKDGTSTVHANYCWTFGKCNQESIQKIKSILSYLEEHKYIFRTKEHKSLRVGKTGMEFLKKPEAILVEKSYFEEPLFMDELLETHEATQILLESGLSPSEISEKRKLTLSTIYSHIAQLVYKQKIKDIKVYVKPETIDEITQVMKDLKKPTLFQIKGKLPEISYSDIKILLAQKMSPQVLA